MKQEEKRKRRCEYSARWYAANRKKAKAAASAYRKANPEKVKNCMVRWRAANLEEDRAKSKTRMAKRRAEYPEQSRAISRRGHAKWKRANPDKVLAETNRRRALLRNAAVPLTPEEQAKVIGIYAEARALTEMIGTPYHVDHVIPLSKGGLHHPNNLQVLRGIDNLRKGAKL